MCRWMAYSGQPILAHDVLFEPKHSIIDQSLHADLGMGVTTNGDGFGIGWYRDSEKLRRRSSRAPIQRGTMRTFARSLRRSATPLLFAHVRASSGTPVERSNCHPFRHGQWLWMHNGSLGRVRRTSGGIW